MKLRYDFDPSHKSYRTFPQKVAHSAGLLDRWSILRWCCPFCLEKPRSHSRKSSGVPVIRITRPRSPDSDQDSEEESEKRRRASVSSLEESVARCPPAGSSWDDDDDDTRDAAGELDVIDEEHDARSFDAASVVSKESLKSKGSVKSSGKSKSSTEPGKSKSSTEPGKSKSSTEPGKSKSSTEPGKSKSSTEPGKSARKGKVSKDSRSNSKESFSSHDSGKESIRDRSRSSMKKIFKHLKRSSSTASSSSGSRREDKCSSARSFSPPSAADEDDAVRAKSSTSSRRVQDEKKRKSMTLDGRGGAAAEVSRSSSLVEGERRGGTLGTLEGRISGRREEPHAAQAAADAAPAEESSVQVYTSTASWQVRGEDEHNHDARQAGEGDQPRCDTEASGGGDSTPATPTTPDIMVEVTFKSPKKRVLQESERNKERGVEVQEWSGPETPPLPHQDHDPPSHDPDSHDPPSPPDEYGAEGAGGRKSGSPSPLVASGGRTSGRDSVASHLSSSTDTCLTHPDEDIERLLQFNEKKVNCLTPLGSRSESMASVCSAGGEGRYGTVVIKGEMELGLQYNYKEGQLECHVLQCRDLAAVDTKRNRSDPYVKVYLLPDKSKSGKRKTKVKKHTLNPIFEEVLRFSTTMSDLESRTLWVSVWHSDMFGRNDFLGEVVISLADTVFDDVSPKWYSLQDRMDPMEDLSYSPRGDLILALKFVPPDAVTTKKSRRSRGALHVLVKEAKSLASAKPHGTADPICKGLLLPEKGKASKQKTSVCRKTLNPTWNHTLMFDDTSLQELTERALELSVWDHDRLGTSQFLGGCRLSLGKGKHGGRPVEWMEAAGMEVRLWEQMLERPNLWVEGSIMLRPAMDRPIYSSSMTE